MNIPSYLIQNWSQLTQAFGSKADGHLEELVKAYSFSTRHYHNLKHIQHLLEYVDEYRDRLSLPDQVQWAIWYHDAVYNPLRKDNEERSAALAKKRLEELGLEPDFYAQVGPWIVATKQHTLPKEDQGFDGLFLLDIDLSILGSERAEYERYCAQIRKEYAMYPKLLYNKGRKKVLSHFLEKEPIYQTKLCRDLWEDKARRNLSWELGILGGTKKGN